MHAHLPRLNSYCEKKLLLTRETNGVGAETGRGSIEKLLRCTKLGR